MEDRPSGWSHDYSPYLNITSHDGKILAPAHRRKDLGAAFAKWRSSWRAEVELQQGRELRVDSRWMELQSELQLKNDEI